MKKNQYGKLLQYHLPRRHITVKSSYVLPTYIRFDGLVIYGDLVNGTRQLFWRRTNYGVDPLYSLRKNFISSVYAQLRQDVT